MFFLKINYFNWRIIILQYCDGFWHTSNESTTGIHVPPCSEPPSHLPPHLTPLGCPRAPALGAVLHASDLLWSSILQMVIYRFQCYSLKSSHPRLLPLSPKVWSLHLCLLCCPACRIVSTVFLNFIYIRCCCLVIKSCPTLLYPMDCSPPGFSVHGISRARILERIAMSSSRGSPSPRNPNSHLHCRWIFYH